MPQPGEYSITFGITVSFDMKSYEASSQENAFLSLTHTYTHIPHMISRLRVSALPKGKALFIWIFS